MDLMNSRYEVGTALLKCPSNIKSISKLIIFATCFIIDNKY